MELDVSAAVWCLEIMQEVLLVEDAKAFFRKYRGTNTVLMAEKLTSRKGVFLKFAKLANGRLQNIIIPSRDGGEWWFVWIIWWGNIFGG